MSHDQVDLGNVRPIDDQVVVISIDLELRVLRLDVHREAGRRKHVVKLAVAATEIGNAAVCEMKVRVLLYRRALCCDSQRQQE